MKKLLLALQTLCGLLVAATTSFAQLPSIPSPTAANIGLYGEIPVSYYTGTPNISIPLYEIKGKSVSIPISLSYHTAGIRPEIHPGPTGLGWTLQAGGAITRTVHGIPDEVVETDQAPTSYVYGYYYAKNSPPIGKEKRTTAYSLSQTYWTSTISNMNCSALRNFAIHYQDLEPDEFSFNFLGISGKFYLDANGNFRVQSDRPIKIEFSPSDMVELSYFGVSYSTLHAPTFKQFTIIDEFGNRYIFGGKNAVEFSDNISRYPEAEIAAGISGRFLYATSWFLSEIVPADGSDHINFSYERGPYCMSFYYSCGSSAASYSINGGWLMGTTRGGIFNSSGCSWQGQIVYPVYLKSIAQTNGIKLNLSYSRSAEQTYDEGLYRDLCPNLFDENYISAIYRIFGGAWVSMGQIEYYKNNPISSPMDIAQWLKLDKINVVNMNNESLSTFDLSYVENSRERLFLKKLSVKDDSNITSQNYTFGYKDRDKLRPYEDTHTDAWGFLNGIPEKLPNPEYVQSGVLNVIRYPTGGISTFEYEIHDCSQIVNSRYRTAIEQGGKAVGGIRIKKITSEDLSGGRQVKEFFYTKDYLSNPGSTTSSGVLNLDPTFDINESDITGCFSGQSVHYSIQGKTPLIPLTIGNDGNHIGYSTVYEKISGNNMDGGYNRYLFTNHDNGYSDDAPLQAWNERYLVNIPHSHRPFERGRMLEQSTYNSAKKMVKSTEWMWQRLGGMTPAENVPALLFGVLLNNVDIGVFHSVAYLNYIYKFVPVAKVETLYDTNGENPIATTTTYTYNSLGLETEQTTTQSDGGQLTTSTRYVGDLTLSTASTDIYVSTFKQMQLLNMVGYPVERSVSSLSPGGQRYLKSAELNLYDRNNGQTPLLRKHYAFTPADQVSSYSFVTNVNPLASVAVDSRLALEQTYESYDSKGNILQYTGQDGVPNSFLWGYQQQYPIAKIVNASYQQVKTALGHVSDADELSYLQSIQGESLKTELTRLRENLPQAMVTSYTHLPQVGISSETLPNGIAALYSYDSFGRLSQILDEQKHIVQQYEYHYLQPTDSIWIDNGDCRCQKTNERNNGYVEWKEIDMNPNSSKQGSDRWVMKDQQQHMSMCPADYWYVCSGTPYYQAHDFQSSIQLDFYRSYNDERKFTYELVFVIYPKKGEPYEYSYTIDDEFLSYWNAFSHIATINLGDPWEGQFQFVTVLQHFK